MDASKGNWAAQLNLDNSWSPPPSSWLKVNFDGSVHPNARAGFGCTIRDDRGMLLAARGGDSTFACLALNRILAGVYHGDVESKLARLMLECPRLVISQIGRRANSAADFVANQACLSDFVWERGMPLPHALSFVLSKDYEPM
ncbi:hypothetical protein KSP39_PZI009312 [Platanthera zijinensis]|uniref:RNase H type-1 domain-containing protein n=1 Tax=Platanthera zijinensis TaxID=2320716 RepID=A0AAP0BLH9_9ASPA